MRSQGWRAPALACALATALAAAPRVPADAQAPELVGTWQGTLRVGPVELRVVFHLRQDDSGSLLGTLDSPDQGATGIPLNSVAVRGDTVRIEVAAVGGRFEGHRSSDGDRIDGTWTQGPNALPLVLERVSEEEAARPAARPQVPRPPFPYRVEEIRFSNPEDGIELAGTLTVPPGAGPFPGVVLVAGSGPQDRDETVAGHPVFLVWADHLAREGLAVLRYDKRGVRASGGDFWTATLRDFTSDARAAVRALAARPEVDSRRVGAVGHSEGAIVVAELAADAEIAFGVLLAPPAVPGDSLLALQTAALLRAAGEPESEVARVLAFNRRAYEIARSETGTARLRARLRALWDEELARIPEAEKRRRGVAPGTEGSLFESQMGPLLAPWVRSFLEADPRPALRRTRVPVLAVFGERDLQVPPDPNARALEEALREAGNSDGTVRVLPRLNHLLQEASTGLPAEYARIEETAAPAALELVADWIAARTGSGR